MVSNGTNKLST